ncbi:MAG: hypothetical protein RL060_2236 [Bacteroidota bacterium]|jgi:hypothetical protein
MRNKIPVPKETFEIVPERGSLGLLALGAVGLMAWREKIAEIKKAKKDANSNNH